jgi:hypothetical protein
MNGMKKKKKIRKALQKNPDPKSKSAWPRNPETFINQMNRN